MPEEKTLERIYVVPLRKEWLKVAHYRRAEKAVRALKAFVAKHMKVALNDVKVGKYLNEAIWQRGAKRPPHKIKIIVKKEKEKVFAELEGYEKLKEKEEKKLKKKKKEKEEMKVEKKEQKEEKAERTQKEEKKESISDENKRAV
ncbi:hypothetical protein DRJ16_03330 [Candidatus Woesearchaeota archaeon]|nr:MAG: hypothetical protein DRJ16_03330 [Candidatus Woesearchaeota archaeon]